MRYTLAPPMANKKTVSAKVDEPIVDALGEFTESHDISTSQGIAELLEERLEARGYLGREEKPPNWFDQLNQRFISLTFDLLLLAAFALIGKGIAGITGTPIPWLPSRGLLIAAAVSLVALNLLSQYALAYSWPARLLERYRLAKRRAGRRLEPITSRI